MTRRKVPRLLYAADIAELMGWGARASMLITMGCGDACPVVPGARRDDWPLGDPKGQPLERVREIRDEIRDRVRSLVGAKGWNRPTVRPPPTLSPVRRR